MFCIDDEEVKVKKNEIAYIPRAVVCHVSHLQIIFHFAEYPI